MPSVLDLRTRVAASASGLRRSFGGWLAGLRGKSGSPEFQFDWLLESMLQQFNAVLKLGNEARPEGVAREALKARAADAATRLATATPPNLAWGELVSDYLELFEIHLRYFGEVLPEDAQRRFAVISQQATDRREALRRLYRASNGRPL